jgi:hypothetical protein
VFPDDEFFLCSLKFGYTTSCVTRYNASSSGQTLEAVCGGERFGKSNFVVDPFKSQETGTLVLNVMGLNAGTSSVYTSNVSESYNPVPAMFTYLQLDKPALHASLPSPVEALLSMATCPVLDLTRDYPFQQIDVCTQQSLVLLTLT